jgi:hypothetical protein
VVFRKLKREQEKACDEMVLKAGIKPSTYANCLLQMKKSFDKKHYFSAAAIAMAGQSEIKDRLLSILKQKLNLKEVKMKTKIMLSIICVLAVTLIGTARPSQSQTAVYPDNGNESAFEARSAEAAAAETKVEVGAAAGKEDKDKKKKKGKANARIKVNANAKVLVKVKEKDTGKGKKVVKEVVIIRKGSDFDIKELKEDEGHLIVTEGSDIYMLTKDKGKLKKVKVDKGKLIIGEGDEPVTIYVQPHIKGKGKVKTVEIVADRLHLEAGSFVIVSTKDGKKWTYMIKEEKSGEEEAESEEAHIEEVTLHLEEGEAVETELVEIHEEAGDLIELKEINLGEGKVLAISEGVKGEKGMFRGFFSRAKLGKKQVYKLMEAVSQLKKKLPACFKVESKIGDRSQKITINCPGDEPDKKDAERAVKAVKDFEKELKKALGVKKSKKH